MTDVFTPQKRSEVMSKIKSKNTKIKLIFEKKIGENKIPYIFQPPIDGHPDFIIKGQKIAVFIDGEFWHGLLWKKYGQVPKTDYWKTRFPTI